MNDILYIYNNSINHDLIYGILHTNKSSWYYNKSPRKIVSGKNTFFIVDFLLNLKKRKQQSAHYQNFERKLWKLCKLFVIEPMDSTNNKTFSVALWVWSTVGCAQIYQIQLFQFHSKWWCRKVRTSFGIWTSNIWVLCILTISQCHHKSEEVRPKSGVPSVV